MFFSTHVISTLVGFSCTDWLHYSAALKRSNATTTSLGLHSYPSTLDHSYSRHGSSRAALGQPLPSWPRDGVQSGHADLVQTSSRRETKSRNGVRMEVTIPVVTENCDPYCWKQVFTWPGWSWENFWTVRTRGYIGWLTGMPPILLVVGSGKQSTSFFLIYSCF